MKFFTHLLFCPFCKDRFFISLPLDNPFPLLRKAADSHWENIEAHVAAHEPVRYETARNGEYFP